MNGDPLSLLITAVINHHFKIYHPFYILQSCRYNHSIAKMQFNTILITLFALLASSDACKCVQGGSHPKATKACCNKLDGNFVGGNDCAAGSISEHLSEFRTCCKGKGFTSDCDFPLTDEAVKEDAVKNK